jgi:5'-3' exonuclease
LIALIDGDIVTFRSAFSAEDEEEDWIANARAGNLIEEICDETDSGEIKVWLSGKNNFRYTVYPEYKANRRDMSRPKWELTVKDYLVSHWKAQYTDGHEADDALGYSQTENTIICTTDKDLNMIPGWHYNFVQRKKYFVSDFEAISFFYQQMLIGDPVDNIKGVPGIGKIKAEKLLRDCTSEEELFEVVREAYSNDEEMLLNGQCLWIWRKLNDIWRLPTAIQK